MKQHSPAPLLLAAALSLLSACGGPSAEDAQSAAAIADKLDAPKRLLIGLGSQDAADVQAQSLRPDLFDQYLVGVGDSSWKNWNSPAGAFVGKFAAEAESVGAVPMYTLYQMAANGDGNLSGLNNSSFMGQYWSNVTLLFDKLGEYGKPAVVNLEPDFWGYVQRQATGGDPAKMAAAVTINPDCTGLPNDVTGIAACLLRSARLRAPRALIGFPVSEWGANSHADVIAFMRRVGANNADLAIITTLDRDAGCFESVPQPSNCRRSGTGWYWDESNTTHPNFHDHFAQARATHEGLGLPLLWWQTPMGVPGSTAGSSGHYRDNRVHYFLTHAQELVEAGGVGVVFSPGSSGQTDITTDGGQFRTLYTSYLVNPAPLD